MSKNELSKQDKMSTGGDILDRSEIILSSIDITENAQLRYTDAGFSLSS